MISSQEIQQLAKKINLDISKYDTDQLRMGYEVEKEHNTKDVIDVVKSKYDPLKIAIAHLRERPNYYTKLKKMENENHWYKPSTHLKNEFQFHKGLVIAFYKKIHIPKIIATEKAIGLDKEGSTYLMEPGDVIWFPISKNVFKFDMLYNFNKEAEKVFRSESPNLDLYPSPVILVLKEYHQSYYLLREDFEDKNKLIHTPIKYKGTISKEKIIQLIHNMYNKNNLSEIRQIIKEEIMRLQLKEQQRYTLVKPGKEHQQRSQIHNRETSLSGWFAKKSNQEKVYETSGNITKIIKVLKTAIEEGELQISNEYFRKIEMILKTKRNDMARIKFIIDSALTGEGLGITK